MLRQRRKRQKRRRNQLAAAANTATTKSLTAAQSQGVRRPLSSDSTEMATIIHSKADDAGVVDGAEVMVVSREDRQPPAAVQTSNSNLRSQTAGQKHIKMKLTGRQCYCWRKLTTKFKGRQPLFKRRSPMMKRTSLVVLRGYQRSFKRRTSVVIRRARSSPTFARLRHCLSSRWSLSSRSRPASSCHSTGFLGTPPSSTCTSLTTSPTRSSTLS